MKSVSKSLSPIYLRKLTREAESLAAAIRQGGSFEPVYEAFSKAIRQIEDTGISLDEVVQLNGQYALGYNKYSTDSGRSFWKAYSEVIRSSLCQKSGELRSQIKTVITAGAGSTISSLMILLGLPIAAAPLLAPIAAILLTLGIDAFCQQSK